MNTRLSWISTAWRAIRPRLIATAVVICLLTMTVYAASDAAYTVNIYDGNSAAVEVRTNKTDANEILKEAGIALVTGDEMTYSGIKDGRGSITIVRAFPVAVTADGKTQRIMLTRGTVADALTRAGVRLGKDDLISHSVGETLTGNEEIVVNRVVYKTEEVREEIPFEVEKRETPLLKPGRSEVLQKGKNGTATRVYTTRVVDGVADEPELTKEFVEAKAVREIVLVGGSDPISDLSFNVDVENHVPTEYSRVLTGCRATGYSARPGVKGASGNRLYYGHVAVNPNVIPYGSKLYIASPDGKFTYGYAIASDTGYALMDGRIDVDLFYETYRESQLNGVRYVNIYVLDSDVEAVTGDPA